MERRLRCSQGKLQQFSEKPSLCHDISLVETKEFLGKQGCTVNSLQSLAPTIILNPHILQSQYMPLSAHLIAHPIAITSLHRKSQVQVMPSGLHSFLSRHLTVTVSFKIGAVSHRVAPGVLLGLSSGMRHFESIIPKVLI